MTFQDVLAQAIDWLRREQRLSYRALKRQFDLDDDYLEDLKEELIHSKRLAVAEDDRVLVWIGGTESASNETPQPSTPSTQEKVSPSLTTASKREPLTYTPPHLAEKILTSRSALEGERKQVTVLFCDLANSTAIAEKIGPEAMHGLLNRFFEVALEEVHRYEGTINQFLGDGFMALYGAPIAHENHARRAVLAAVGLRQRLHEGAETLGQQFGVEVEIRMGLHTGEVIVGAIGDNLRMDYTAVGDTTNTASRLQGAATPGQIVISEALHRLVEGYGTTHSLGALSLKGKAEPVQAWEVLRVSDTRSRLDVEAERGLTPFVGRERELQLLTNCFTQVQRGHGQFVFIVGEAGLGKSRLLLEFRRRLGADATWLEGRAMSFGRSFAFHPVIDLLKRNFRLQEDDAEATRIAKIDQRVLSLSEAMRPMLPYVRYLLAVDPGDPVVEVMDPQLRRAEIFDALRQLMLRAAEVRPQVLVFEDLHWMDQATEAFLTFIADSIPTSRALCLFTYRPGYTHPFGDRSYHTRVVLPTLSTVDSVHMAAAMLGAANLPAELDTLIAQKAEGNPFFVEEVVKSLHETGTIRRQDGRYVLTRPLGESIVPDTIQDVLMARIDRLEEAPKKALQLAAVIGREFTHRLLERLADIRGRTEASLQELKAIELIYEKTLYPELVYMFKHALTQDVAYHSLLEQRRIELHGLIGQAIEALYTDRLAEQFDMLAYHFARGERWDKALTYFGKAAEKAAQAFATREALELYEQAFDAAGHLGDTVPTETLMEMHRARAELYYVRSDFARSQAESEALLALAQQVGDRARQAAALAAMGLAAGYAHDIKQGLYHARQAIELAEQAQAQSVLPRGHYQIGLFEIIQGRLAPGRQEIDRALTLSTEVGDVTRRALSLYALGFIERLAGAYVVASHYFTESLQLSKRDNLLYPMLSALFGQGILLVDTGHYDDALTTFEEALSLGEKAGHDLLCYRLLNSFGWLYSECGNLDRALDLNRQSAEGARKRNDPEIIANAELNLGDIFLAQGDLRLAQAYLDGVYRLTHDPATSAWMKWRYSMHLFCSLGELWLARGDAAKAQKCADQCLDLATRTTSRKYQIAGWRLKGEIAIAHRQWDEAQGWLHQALTMAQEVGNPTQLWKTYVALGHFHRTAKRPEQARQTYHAARAVIDHIKGNLQSAELRACLEGSPLIQQVYDLSPSE
jgi:class 3 adenylate cyclase/tetratricopeptide (TPR) repeat protein